MGVLIIDYVGHVNDFVIVVALKAGQVQVGIEQLVHLVRYAFLDFRDLAFLGFEKLFQVLRALVLVLVEYHSDLRKVLLDLGLDDVPVPFLYALEVLLTLL